MDPEQGLQCLLPLSKVVLSAYEYIQQTSKADNIFKIKIYWQNLHFESSLYKCLVEIQIHFTNTFKNELTTFL